MSDYSKSIESICALLRLLERERLRAEKAEATVDQYRLDELLKPQKHTAALTRILNVANTRDPGEGCGAVPLDEKIRSIRLIAIEALSSGATCPTDRVGSRDA